MDLVEGLVTCIAAESTAVVALFAVVHNSYKTCEKERNQLWRHIVRIYKYLPTDAPRSLEDIDEEDGG